MNAAQLAAFRAASGVTASTLLLAIASMVLLLAFVWVMWVTLGTFRAWQDGKASLFDLTWSALRASVILMVSTPGGFGTFLDINGLLEINYPPDPRRNPGVKGICLNGPEGYRIPPYWLIFWKLFRPSERKIQEIRRDP